MESVFQSFNFFIGADLKERSTMKEEEIGPHVTRYRKLFDDLSKISVPVIAALDGAALGRYPFFFLTLYQF